MTHRPVIAAVFMLMLSSDSRVRAVDLPLPSREPLHRVVDLDIGESRQVELRGGAKVQVKLLALEESRDSIRDAVRRAVVKVEVDGQAVELTSATYHLPRTVAGVQIDCPITRGYMTNTDQDHWGLDQGRAAAALAGRLAVDRAGHVRLSGPPALVRQRDPDGQRADVRRWHRRARPPQDLLPLRPRHRRRRGTGRRGRRDRRTGRLRRQATLPGYEDTPVDPRYDVVYLLDDRGWYYRYSHLHSIDAAIKPGANVAMGQKIGVLGKEGGSGGWSHLHFEIVSRQPSGSWGTAGGLRLPLGGRPAGAAARSHRRRPAAPTGEVGERVALDGSLSWSRSGRIAHYDWTFSDGTTASGARVERAYERAGEYSEVLKITDGRRNVSYDFAVVQVLDPSEPGPLPPGIHAALCSDAEPPSGRPDHVQGAHVRHDRRKRDLGLRRRHAAGGGPLRRQRQAATRRRLCDRDPPLRPAGRLPATGRADGRTRPQGDGAAIHARRAGTVSEVVPTPPALVTIVAGLLCIPSRRFIPRHVTGHRSGVWIRTL